MKRLLYRFRALADRGSYELRLFGDIGDFGKPEFVTANDVVAQIEQVQASRIVVRVASHGGLVSDGLRIYNALVASGAEVVIRIEGMTGSIAGIIAMAGDQVLIAPNAQLMIHQSEATPDGNADRLREVAQALDNTDQVMAQIYAAKTGRTADEELALMKRGERYLTAEQAIAEGYADALLELAPIQARAVQAFAAAALRHYLPKAGKQAPLIAAWIKHASTTAATAAIPPSPETRTMKFMNIAKMLGLTLADGADEAAARLAVLQYLGLTEDAEDATVVEAMAAMVGELAAPEAAAMTDEEKSAATAKARAVIAARAARTPAPAAPGSVVSPMQARAREVGELFDIAQIGRSDRAVLNGMRAAAVLSDKPISEIRAELTAYLGNGVKPVSAVHVEAGTDQRDKFRAAGVNWLIARAGAVRPGTKEAEGLNGNRFRGMNLHDIARDCLEESGGYRRGMNRGDVIRAAITHSTSDFPNIFENALNKMLLDGFALQQPSWNRFAKTGSLTDFRPHIRYRSGSIGDLEVRQQNGEFKSLTLSDAERETITALNRGGILNVSFEMIVNDDMSVFTDAARMLGTSAARTLDKAVFALFALNSGNGPTMGDNKTLFHTDHANVAATAARPTVLSIEQARVQMASQLDVSGNDYLDLRPDRFLGPLSVGGEARVVNNSTYDPDVNGKLQRFNISGNLFTDIIDTPRLSGNAWYVLANPNIEPVFEVGFLDGQQQPQLEQEEAFSQHGMRWRMNYPFGVAAIGWRGIVKNAGVS